MPLDLALDFAFGAGFAFAFTAALVFKAGFEADFAGAAFFASTFLAGAAAFAGIAFFIINKLISTLGSASSDDPAKSKGFFGENLGKAVAGSSVFLLI